MSWIKVIPFEEAKGKLKAIWIICTNPLVSLPDARKMEKALQNAKFVVVQDISNRSDKPPTPDSFSWVLFESWGSSEHS